MYIWRDGGAFGRMGHAALKVHAIGPNGPTKRYISWWPDEDAGNGIKALFEARQQGYASDDYAGDKRDEMGDATRSNLLSGAFAPRGGQQIKRSDEQELIDQDAGYRSVTVGTYNFVQAPDEKITLPGIRSEAFGIFPEAAWFWFVDFRDEDGEYKAASRRHNCSGVVRRALKFAGLEALAPAPAANVWASPTEVGNWARSAAQKLTTLNGTASSFAVACPMRKREALAVLGSTTDLPDRHRWKAISTRPNGKRGQNVAKVDQYLQQIHNAKGRLGHPDGRVALIKATAKAFEVVNTAARRHAGRRDDHDRKVLVALGHRLLRSA